MQEFPLSKKDRRKLARTVENNCKDLALAISSAKEVKMIRTKIGERKVSIILVDMFPALIIERNYIFPTIYLIRRATWRPYVIVDKGAAERVGSGAHVMVPGIVEVGPDFDKDKVVAIYSEDKRAVAVGVALMSKDEIMKSKRGKAIQNLHYNRDKICKFIISLFT